MECQINKPLWHPNFDVIIQTLLGIMSHTYIHETWIQWFNVLCEHHMLHVVHRQPRKKFDTCYWNLISVIVYLDGELISKQDCSIYNFNHFCFACFLPVRFGTKQHTVSKYFHCHLAISEYKRLLFKCGYSTQWHPIMKADKVYLPTENHSTVLER